jgi:hypothetical protein
VNNEAIGAEAYPDPPDESSTDVIIPPEATALAVAVTVPAVAPPPEKAKAKVPFG